jgi:hypothetical protein
VQGGGPAVNESFLHEMESKMINKQLIEMHIEFKCFIVVGLGVIVALVL